METTEISQHRFSTRRDHCAYAFVNRELHKIRSRHRGGRDKDHKESMRSSICRIRLHEAQQSARHFGVVHLVELLLRLGDESWGDDFGCHKLINPTFFASSCILMCFSPSRLIKQSHAISSLTESLPFHPQTWPAHQLQIVDLLVQAAFFQQFIMRAALNNAAFVHHKDHVRAPYGGQAMRDHET
jgi:hypothetical protein